jgi:hypothetical protein
MEILLLIVGISLLLLPLCFLGVIGYAGWLWHKGRANELTGPVKGLLKSPHSKRRILYLLTLSIECSLALIRAIVFGFLMSLLFSSFVAASSLLIAPSALTYTDGRGLSALLAATIGSGGVGFLFGVLIAYTPIVLSVATWIGMIPGGNIVTRWALNAREPSRREFQKIQDELEVIEARCENFKEPTNFFIIDEVIPNAYIVGSTLYLTKDLVRGDYLLPVLAQALGYVHTGDGLRLLALRRLVLPPFYWLSREKQTETLTKAVGIASQAERLLDIRMSMKVAASGAITTFVLACIGGGIGVLLLSMFWESYWSHADYAADDFAGQCGLAEELVDYLDTYNAFVFPIPYQMNTRPPIELRRDNLFCWISDTEGAEVF